MQHSSGVGRASRNPVPAPAADAGAQHAIQEGVQLQLWAHQALLLALPEAGRQRVQHGRCNVVLKRS